MDKPPLPQLDRTASELSLNDLTPVTSCEGDYEQSPHSATSLQPEPFLYDPSMAQNLYHQQQFNLQYQPTQNLFSIDSGQLWTGSTTQHNYIPSAPSSLPEQSTSAPLTSTFSVRHDYVLLAKRPSITGSIHSTVSDGEEHMTPDEAGERRRERRRAQNRAAQRAFRARKEETIKESSTRLDALKEELVRLQFNNDGLFETISNLQAQIALLQRENAQLRRNGTSNIDWDNFDMSAMDAEILNQPLAPPELKTEPDNDSGVFDLSSTNKQLDAAATELDETAGASSRGQRASAAMIAEAIADAAATLHPGR